MVAKPHPQNNGAAGVPSSASSVAAGTAAAAGVAAGKAAGTAKGMAGQFSSWWQSLTAQAGPVQGELQKAAKLIRAKAQRLKLAMPVDVKVDFLRPTVEAVRDTVQTVWVQLPPPVQQAAPFMGVALGSGLLVFAIQQHRLGLQRRKTDDVKVELQNLLKERAKLLKQIGDLQAKPQTDMELRLSRAVAEATTAAAAAAEAAAHAAVACVVRRPPLPPPSEVN